MFINNEWKSFLRDEFEKDYFQKLTCFIDAEFSSKIIYPEYSSIFRAFNLLKPNEVKVVIIGQDPYHGPNQANGLAFSVSKQCKIPPSLVNIYKELVDDIGCEYPKYGDLTSWAIQGVLMINSVLTVEKSLANSHQGKGWEIFTDAVIKKLSNEYENIVFVLWGNPSQKKEFFIDSSKHLILKAPHPSPLSAYRGFFGSKPFSKINNYLKIHNREPIDWALSAQQTLL